MKSKCCNKPLRLSRENPEPGETMYYICDGCNQPADPRPAGDVPDCYSRKETMISDSAHSYQLGYAKGKQEEREKVLSEVEELLIEHFAGSGELFFPYVGCGASSKADEREFAKQVILDALGRKRVYDKK